MFHDIFLTNSPFSHENTPVLACLPDNLAHVPGVFKGEFVFIRDVGTLAEQQAGHVWVCPLAKEQTCGETKCHLIVIPFESMRGFYRLPWLVKVEEINCCVSLSTNYILMHYLNFSQLLKISHMFLSELVCLR